MGFDTAFIQVMTTFERREDADGMAGHLVRERLAACAQVIGPIFSTYHWQGEVVTGAQEWLCLVKTRAALYPQVEREIKSRHAYTCPEILAVPVVAGHPDYLAWMERELKPTESGTGVPDGGK